MARLLALMGSGETTPTMVETHKRLLGALDGRPDAVIVDTPYGFQENADDLSRRTVDYFGRNVGHSVRPVHLRRPADEPASTVEVAIGEIETADWVFAGPGSPTYLLRQWQPTRLPDVLRTRLRRSGVTVFASAAVCSVGTHTLPVYEIYKVGMDPWWEPGLRLLAELGLDCVAIPHWDNAEGGHHDTRYCYLGATRLARLEDELPEDGWILGIDEHTALVLDLDAGTYRIEGRGTVTVRSAGREDVLAPGTTGRIEDLPARAVSLRDGDAPRATIAQPAAAPVPAPDSQNLGGEIAALESRFDTAMADGDAIAASRAVLDLEDTIHAWAADPNQSDDVDRARRALRGMVVRVARIAQDGLHDHRALVAPHVETLLDLRESARADRDWSTADLIRDSLVDGGVEVQDTADGTAWELRDDPTGADRT